MLTNKEKVISSIFCVISVFLLIASLCFTTLLFTTHGTVMKAEAAVDITSDQYAEYFSEEIYPDGTSFLIDESYFDSYDSSLGGYFAQIELDTQTYSPLRLDVAYRCNVAMSDGSDIYLESKVFFPSAFSTDGTIYWGFCFAVELVDVQFIFFDSSIEITIYCDSNYYVDTFVFSEVPSLTISSFYSSYQTLAISDGLGLSTDDYSSNGTCQFYIGDSLIPMDYFDFPCFLMLKSNVGDLLVYSNPYLQYSERYNNLRVFRVVGIPNNFFTYCTYDETVSEEAFTLVTNFTFDSDFVFEFNDVYLVAPVPLNQAPVEDDPSINESLGEVLLQGMSFGFESIGEGITYTFNNLFLDDEGKLSTFTYVIVFTLGIGIVLGFIKWLLSYILSLGGKD